MQVRKMNKRQANTIISDYYSDIKNKRSACPKIRDKKQILPNRKVKESPCETIKLGVPVDWESYKAVSDSLKEEYIESILNDFPGISAKCFAAMWNIAASTASKELKRLGIKPRCTKKGTKNFYLINGITPYDEMDRTKEVPIIKDEPKKQRKITKGALREEIKSLKKELKEKKDLINMDLLDGISFTADSSEVTSILKRLHISGKVKITVDFVKED